MKRIFINWKWLNVESLPEDETPTNLGQENFFKIIPIENNIGEIVILNLEREEIEFEDEYEHYEERDELLIRFIQQLHTGDSIVFLHRNAPHFYEDFDSKFLQKKLPKAEIVLFGGGEDKIYDLYNKDFGLLDQVGNFTTNVTNQKGEIKQDIFEQIWDYYRNNKEASTEEILKPLELMMAELMPLGNSTPTAIMQAQKILDTNPVWLGDSIKQQLQQLSDNNSAFDWLKLREEWQKTL